MKFAKEVGESPTYQFAQAAAEMRAQGRDIISLGLGEPDFETPDYVIDALEQAIRDGYTHYSATQGLPELREFISLDCNTSWGSNYSQADAIVTPGIKAAIYFALASILEPGDEVVLISPYYVSYPAMVKLAEPDASIVDVPLRADFSLDKEALESAFSLKTKVVLVNSPNNPTGKVLSEDDVRFIAELTTKNKSYIISDEVYSKLTFGGSYASFGVIDGIRDRLVVVNGYSKSHAMTGWRLGYAIGAHDVVLRMNRMQQHINTNTCTFVQKAACAVYENEPVHLVPYVEEIKKRADYFCTHANELDYMRIKTPEAGFFCFADISPTGANSNEFCADLLLETGIASTPGIAFGSQWDNYVRFSLATSTDTLKQALCLLENYSFERERTEAR